MAFYENFESLCKERGISPTRAARDNGLKQQSVSSWKTRGSTPKAETVQKLADYFGVSMAELLGDSPIIFTVSIAELQDDLEKRARWRKGPHARAISALEQMNEQGQSKVADYAEDILPRYRAEPAPEAPPPSEGTEPTPAPDTPGMEKPTGGPENGE